jgi:ABC-2 type transport system ATP-binding protein
VTAVVEARALGRWYGQVVGLNDLTVEIRSGITGLIGPNGAGKSTFLKLVAGEIRPSRGTIRVLGMQPFANRELFRRLGFCPQQDALYDYLTGQDFVALLLRLSGYRRAEATERAARALALVGLTDAAGRRTGTYSKGMRQRAKLAQSIAHEPELLVVDEPLTGLDPVVRAEMVALFRRLAADGMRILVSSHVLHEIESLTDEIVLLHHGRLLAQGSVVEVRDLLSRHPRRIELVADEPRRLARSLIELEGVSSVRVIDEAQRLSVETRDAGAFFRRMTAVAADGAFGVRRMECADENLEAVFDYLVH